MPAKKAEIVRTELRDVLAHSLIVAEWAKNKQVFKLDKYIVFMILLPAFIIILSSFIS